MRSTAQKMRTHWGFPARERPQPADAEASVTTFEARNPGRTGGKCGAKVPLWAKQLPLHLFLEVCAYDQGMR